MTPRALALAATLLAAAPSAAATMLPGPHAMRPVCVSDLAVRAGTVTTTGDVHEVTVLVSRTAGFPCVVANFPQPVQAPAGGPPTPLRTGRLSLAQSVTVGGGTTAAFLLRYTTPATTPAPAATATAAPGPVCNISIFVNGVAAKGPPIPAGACGSLIAVAVSSFGGGTTPPEDATASEPAAKLACRPQDLELRDAGPDPGTGTSREVYALQNVGLAACRLSGAVGARLLDVHGMVIPLRAAARTAMPMVLTLPRGHDASFALAYAAGGPNGEQRCVTAQTIAVTIPPWPTTITATTHVAPCPPATGTGMRISNLQLGVPLPGAAGT